MYKRILLLATALLIWTSSFTQIAGKSIDQPPTSDFRKNVIRGSIGYFLIYAHASASYERFLWGNSSRFFQSFWISAGGGKYWILSDNGIQTNAKVMTLLGRKNNHLELGFGVMALKVKTEDEFRINPAGNIGYRYQKTNGHFMFRAGLGLPEALYVGIGVVF